MQEHVVVRLPHAVRAELKMIAVLAPTAVTNLAAEWSADLVASDASPFAEGAARAPVPPALARELWRHRDKRGAYTRIRGHWAGQLHLDDVDEEPDWG